MIHKGLRSEVNQLKIKCSNHGEGCQWTGELGALKKHLESNSGCDFVMVKCPNRCGASTLRRKDVTDHLTQSCYLRPYQCEFCGLKDTYEEITGYWERMIIKTNEDDYFGHQAKCPEAPLTCPNKCGKKKIKRKDMEGHYSQCPQEPVECPFAEAGCKVYVLRHQLEEHMTASLQQHLMLLMIDRKQLKGELNEMVAKLGKAETDLDETKCKLRNAETEISETKLKLHEAETRLAFCEAFDNSANKLRKYGDSMKITMPGFSEYRHSGKVWHSPPFYYREGYKMCMAVYANGVGKGAGTHVSVTIVHLGGEYDDKLKWPMKSCPDHISIPARFEARIFLRVCQPLQRLLVNECKQISCRFQFCSLDSEALHLENDCLSFNVRHEGCHLGVYLE